MKPLLLIALLSVASFAFSQEDQKNGINAALISKNYTFKATSVIPARGRIIQLTTNYDLKVNKDSTIAYLPYFGRAYSAPIGGSGGGIEFTSTNFEHTVSNRKKGGWRVEIRFKDAQDVQQMYLTVSENGNASLQVTSNNRQSISYNGEVIPGK